MASEFDQLRQFIERVRSIGLFERLFSWTSVRNQLVDTVSALTGLTRRMEQLQGEKSALQTELATKSVTVDNLRQLQSQMTSDLATLRERLNNTEYELRVTREECITLKQEEEFRKSDHSKIIASLENIRDTIQAEREKEKQDRMEQELERLEQLKATWMNHQTLVKRSIKSICSRHTIEYLETVPFRGEPDNTLQICDEFVVFDAKSPANDDLTNFPSYLKDQAEKAKKYAKQENVKTDIFFVVPSNTLEALKQHTYHLGDYNVYIVSLDSLEPLVLCLKKIEEYEFAEQLSPEERENICRIIGKFAHLTKRRIQIDSFFARQFIEIAYKCENDLPADILEKVIEFERSEKLNPPMEKRAKSISTKQLELETQKIELEAGSKGILMEEITIYKGLNGVPLYRDNE